MKATFVILAVILAAIVTGFAENHDHDDAPQAFGESFSRKSEASGNIRGNELTSGGAPGPEKSRNSSVGDAGVNAPAVSNAAGNRSIGNRENTSAIKTLALVTGGGSSSASSSDAIQSSSAQALKPLHLDIGDQDEPFGDGVKATWTATDMMPGDNYDFFTSFVRMVRANDSIVQDANHTGIAARYSVTEEIPCLESDTDCRTDLRPDEMAKEMIFTRCVYRAPGICIDCITGKKTDGYDAASHKCTGFAPQAKDDWRIDDQDSDGEISFYDMKHDALDNLPVPRDAVPSQFEFGVKFDEDAGNDFQGDTLELFMVFILNQDGSQ